MIPDFNLPFEVITDASDYALGALLIQQGKHVAYESRILNSAERNYHTTDKEMLAIVHALKIWHCYLEGTSFKVLTDHQPLIHFPTQPILSRRQVRWSDFLQQFDLKWEFLPGVDNPAHSLSRLGNLEKESKLNMIGMVFSKIGTASKFGMIGSSISKYNSIHNKRFHKQLLSGAREVGSLDVDPIEVAEIKEAYKEGPWFSNQENVDTLSRVDGLYWKGVQLAIPNNEGIKDKIILSCHDSL
jgi:hypothetical protein